MIVARIDRRPNSQPTERTMTSVTEPGLIGVAVDLMARHIDRALEVTALAERHRADFVSVPDHPYLAGELDTWTMLTLLAARTERIAVASNVTSLPLRPAPMLAKTAASLQVLSGGRTILGIGAGVPAGRSFGADPWNADDAVSALEEALQLIRQLWRPGQQGEQSYQGRYYRVEGVRFGPVPSRPVPIWVGAFGPRMLELTGRDGDGWLPTNYYLDLADVPDMQRRIDQAAEGAGRGPTTIRRVFNVMGTITDEAPTENGRRLVGSASLWGEALNDYHDRLGFDGFTFWPVAGDRTEQVARFFEEVRPQLPAKFQPAVQAARLP
jgi:alkanesulfonate monooxygenase SsuD/methylene tetrahydromethanopterin reductase-like flavin-dependent oxidoreductase (luciferase family)